MKLRPHSTTGHGMMGREKCRTIPETAIISKSFDGIEMTKKPIIKIAASYQWL